MTASEPQFDPVTESDLQGFIDGRLVPERHMEIDGYLAGEPALRARVEACRAVNRSLHGLYGSQPILVASAGLRDLERRLGNALVRRHRFRWGLAVAAAMIISAGIGSASSYLTRPNRVAANAVAQFTAMAASAHHLFAENDDGIMRISAVADQGAVLFKAMADYLPGLPERAPDLSGFGYQLAGGQINPGTDQPSLHFVYRNETGMLISLHTGFAASQAPVSPTRARDGSVPAVYWHQDGIAYALVGHVPEADLQTMARAIFRGEQPPAPVPSNARPALKQAATPAREARPGVPEIKKTLAPAAEPAPVPRAAPPVPEVEPASLQEPKDT